MRVLKDSTLRPRGQLPHFYGKGQRGQPQSRVGGKAGDRTSALFASDKERCSGEEALGTVAHEKIKQDV